MKTEKNAGRKLLTAKRVRALIVFAVIAAVAAAGFAHQRYLRSDSHIKDVWSENKESFEAAAQEITGRGETFGRLPTGTCQKRLETGSRDFDKLIDIGISHVSYDGSDICLYSEYDHYYIFHTDGESAGRGHETPLDSSWGYIKTKK